MRDRREGEPWVLLVTRNFPPLVGGMEKVNSYLVRSLASDREVGLCGPQGCASFASGASVVRETATRPLAMFLLGTLAKALPVAWRWRRRPGIVFAGSGLTAPIAFLAAKAAGARSAVYLHGLDIVAPSRVYQIAWLPFIRACDLAIVNSQHTRTLALSAGLRPERVDVLHPGTDVPEALDVDVAFRHQHGLGARPLLLSVGRLTRRKGLAEFVGNALPRIAARHPEVVLVVIGEEATDALNSRAGSERNRIEAAAREAGVSGHLLFVGRCEELALRAAYQTANCHVFPVMALPGDVEGFGMVALESAAHGLRTVAFAVGGVPDAVSPGRSGTLVEPGNYLAFADAVSEIIAAGSSVEVATACREFARDKDWSRFGERLRALLPN